MLKALNNLLKGDIIKEKKRRIKEMEVQKITLTTEELHLLLTINAITEFNKEQPGNIPAGGIGEVIVSNAIMESEDFDKLSDKLLELELIDKDCFISALGCEYLSNFAEDLERKEKDKDATCKINFSNIDFQCLAEKLSETAKKINWSKAIDFVYKGISIIAALTTIGKA